LILFPSRYIYLALLLLILIGYLTHKQFSLVIELIENGLRKIPIKLRLFYHRTSETDMVQSLDKAAITDS